MYIFNIYNILYPYLYINWYKFKELRYPRKSVFVLKNKFNKIKEKINILNIV